ncbi:MAG: winged helix-turn-helix transcriptional regulator [Muribaculaceae bacterium]
MMEVSDIMFPNCPVRNVLARVGDKWSLLVLNALQRHAGPMRFGELRKALPDVSSKILTTTLRNLEADGFLVREVFAEVPPRVEYRLTGRALSFIAACRPMIQWAIDNLSAILADRRASEQKR